MAVRQGEKVKTDVVEKIESGESSEGRERRRSRRFPCEGFAEVLVLQPETLFRGEIQNISLTGCFVRSRARLQVERLSPVELRFQFNNLRYHAYALVMDIRPGEGVGLEFYFKGAQPEEWLRELIQSFNVATPQIKA